MVQTQRTDNIGANGQSLSRQVSNVNVNGPSIKLGINAGVNHNKQDGKNVFIGTNSGANAINSENSIFLGKNAGQFISNSSTDNILIGSDCGKNQKGSQNTCIGFAAGFNNKGSLNIAIGNQAGYETGNKAEKNIYIGFKSGKGTTSTTGSENVFIGISSGEKNIEGSSNVFLGIESGFENKSGNENVFLGYKTGSSNQTGSQNVFLGTESGINNDSGSNNVFLGYRTGANNESGSYNVFLGSGSGENNTTGSYNIFLGYNAGRNNNGSSNIVLGINLENINGDNNTFLGSDGGGGEVTGFTGSSNTILGVGAGINNQGSLNTFIGVNTGRNNTNGDNNTFLGSSAGQSNTNGYNNVFIGKQSGFSSENSNDNVFLGTNSGYDNTGGSSNVFLGTDSGYFNDQGSRNVFLGTYSGKYNSGILANDNVFLGTEAGFSNSGSNNVFLGNDSGKFNNGTENIFLGNSAGLSNQGTNNVFLGTNAGTLNTAAQNIFIGNEAGKSNVSGSNNILIGYKTGKSNVGNNNVIMGNSAGLSNLGNNNVFLGNNAGLSNTSYENIFIGNDSGNSNKGTRNVFLGYNTGKENKIGCDNIIIGTKSGQNMKSGDQNVLIGYKAGFDNNNTVDNLTSYLVRRYNFENNIDDTSGNDFHLQSIAPYFSPQTFIGEYSLDLQNSNVIFSSNFTNIPLGDYEKSISFWLKNHSNSGTLFNIGYQSIYKSLVLHLKLNGDNINYGSNSNIDLSNKFNNFFTYNFSTNYDLDLQSSPRLQESIHPEGLPKYITEVYDKNSSQSIQLGTIQDLNITNYLHLQFWYYTTVSNCNLVQITDSLQNNKLTIKIIQNQLYYILHNENPVEIKYNSGKLLENQWNNFTLGINLTDYHKNNIVNIENIVINEDISNEDYEQRMNMVYGIGEPLSFMNLNKYVSFINNGFTYVSDYHGTLPVETINGEKFTKTLNENNVYDISTGDYNFSLDATDNIVLFEDFTGYISDLKIFNDFISQEIEENKETINIFNKTSSKVFNNTFWNPTTDLYLTYNNINQKYAIQSSNNVMTKFEYDFINDGKWHNHIININENEIEVFVDKISKGKTNKLKLSGFYGLGNHRYYSESFFASLNLFELKNEYSQISNNQFTIINELNGYLDDFRIYSKKLNSSDIDNIYEYYGFNNLFLGSLSGVKNVQGTQNIMIGTASGYNNESGNRNIGIGYKASLKSKGTDNICIGNSAGENNLGNENISIGTNSNSQNENGKNQVIIGTKAGQYNDVQNHQFNEIYSDIIPYDYILNSGYTIYKLPEPSEYRVGSIRNKELINNIDGVSDIFSNTAFELSYADLEIVNKFNAPYKIDAYSVDIDSVLKSAKSWFLEVKIQNSWQILDYVNIDPIIPYVNSDSSTGQVGWFTLNNIPNNPLFELKSNFAELTITYNQRVQAGYGVRLYTNDTFETTGSLELYISSIDVPIDINIVAVSTLSKTIFSSSNGEELNINNWNIIDIPQGSFQSNGDCIILVTVTTLSNVEGADLSKNVNIKIKNIEIKEKAEIDVIANNNIYEVTNSIFSDEYRIRAFYNRNSDKISIKNVKFYFKNQGNNVFIGNQAGEYNQSINNIFIGNECGRLNNSGKNNVCIGINNSQTMRNGKNNVILGVETNTKGEGNDNIYVGYRAGHKNKGNNNIFIGSHINENNEQISNELNIGNLIKGDLNLQTTSINNLLIERKFELPESGYDGQFWYTGRKLYFRMGNEWKAILSDGVLLPPASSTSLINLSNRNMVEIFLFNIEQEVINLFINIGNDYYIPIDPSFTEHNVTSVFRNDDNSSLDISNLNQNYEITYTFLNNNFSNDNTFEQITSAGKILLIPGNAVIPVQNNTTRNILLNSNTINIKINTIPNGIYLIDVVLQVNQNEYVIWLGDPSVQIIANAEFNNIEQIFDVSNTSLINLNTLNDTFEIEYIFLDSSENIVNINNDEYEIILSTN